jgi:hypothetical protein
MRICSSSVGRGAVIAAVVLASGASAASVAAGAPASGTTAATIAVARPCYVNKSRSKLAPMTVTGSGFAPGGQVQISSSDGSVKLDTTASSTGAVTATTSAPDPSFALPGQKTVTLTASENTIVATTPVTVAPLAVGISPAEAAAAQKVTWYFSGFEPGKPIFGHYLRTKQVALTRFGRAGGACGVLATKARLYPGGHPRYHLYGLQLDDSMHYSKRSSPRLDKQIAFQLVPAPPAHRAVR